MKEMQKGVLNEAALAQKRQVYFEEYMLQFSLQWNEDAPGVIRQLSKITAFAEEEIKSLQIGFREFLKETCAAQDGAKPVKQGISKQQCLQLIDQFSKQYARENKKDFIELSP